MTQLTRILFLTFNIIVPVKHSSSVFLENLQPLTGLVDTVILLPLSILTTFSLLVRLRKEPFNQLARDNKDKPVQDNFGVAH